MGRVPHPATVAEGNVQLWSRNALEWTGKIPEIRDAVAALGLTSAALDGELIAGAGTKEDFNLLQATLSGERQGVLTYALFDLLHLDGVDVADAPLLERKALLQSVLEGQGRPLAFSSHVQGDGDEAYRGRRAAFRRHHLQRADRSYHSGRSEDWRKTKQLASDEFAVVGYTAPKGSRTGFGSLLLARPDAKHGWLYAGRVGSGFSDELIGDISKRIKGGGGRKADRLRAHAGHRPARCDLVRATLVVEVFYRGIGGQKLLRQASLKAVRADKDTADLADSDRAGTSPAAARTPAARDLRARPGRHRWRIACRRRCPFRARSCFPATVTPSRTCGITTRQ